MSTEKLFCEPCKGKFDPLSVKDIKNQLEKIDSEWTISEDLIRIERRFKFKNFAKTMFFVNALAHMADQQGHHPDVSFGYNYCNVSYTTHEACGLTINDFICAQEVDNIIVQHR